MRKTIKALAIDAIQAKLEKITVENQYNTDAGRRVVYGQEALQPNNQLPYINFFDGEETAKNRQWFGADFRTFSLMVIGFDQYQENDLPRLGERLRADIEVAIFTKDDNKIDTDLGGACEEIKLIDLEVANAPPDSRNINLGSILIRFEVDYLQRTGDPYSKPY